jgi:hypothetical protein
MTFHARQRRASRRPDAPSRYRFRLKGAARRGLTECGHHIAMRHRGRGWSTGSLTKSSASTSTQHGDSAHSSAAATSVPPLASAIPFPSPWV